MTTTIPVIEPQELFANKNQYQLIDVRTNEEFTGELGHVEDSRLVVLGPDLEIFLKNEDKTKPTVFICRSGGRSNQATAVALSLGWTSVWNMKGGMLLWNQLELPKWSAQ